MRETFQLQSLYIQTQITYKQLFIVLDFISFNYINRPVLAPIRIYIDCLNNNK